MALRREQFKSNHYENQATGKEGEAYTCRLFGMSSLKERAMWHVARQ
jgi:hypothetical protein